MKRELDFYSVNGGYGWNQEWFSDRMMRLGGCAAVAACDYCIYMKKFFGNNHLYPYDTDLITKEDYVSFSKIMKPYLHPRWSGIDRLELFIDGVNSYFRDNEETGIASEGFDGNNDILAAQTVIMDQIDRGITIPYLLLKHSDKQFADYIWHWFTLTGYDNTEGFKVKAVTEGAWRWLDLAQLWNTGFDKKGGMILFHLETQNVFSMEMEHSAA